MTLLGQPWNPWAILHGSFPLGQFPASYFPTMYTWKQRCLALSEICRWREPVPTRVSNPNAIYKLERQGEEPWGGIAGGGK